MSGGEPFLRTDIVEICQSAHNNCKPNLIIIPTNGILYEIIPEKVKEIIEVCPNSHIIVNLSLDMIGEQHDEIRGVKGNFERAMKTYESLKSLNRKNLEIGIHTVISIFNVHKMPQIYEEIEKMKPDSYITEIAEERVELGTMGMNITPSWEDYSKAIDYLSKKIEKQKFKGVSKITQAFRLEYYKLVMRILKERRQVIPCYAGTASAQIAPNGDVWFCCIKADPVGNLRDFNYEFKTVWFNEKADRLRKSIKAGKCYCPLANASYTNMLCNFKTLAKVGWRWLRWRTS
jgi:MoaA/NifB/PqqE/SkfB family radical SAM enzyme